MRASVRPSVLVRSRTLGVGRGYTVGVMVADVVGLRDAVALVELPGVVLGLLGRFFTELGTDEVVEALLRFTHVSKECLNCPDSTNRHYAVSGGGPPGRIRPSREGRNETVPVKGPHGPATGTVESHQRLQM